MKKMIKTAIVTTSILASASVFAQNVGANASGSAQVSVQSNGLIKGVTGAVKNTAQGVGQTAQHVGHAAVNTGVNVTQKRWALLQMLAHLSFTRLVLLLKMEATTR
ncbi:signal peptide [Acinetobacter haemolyticus]|nr:signal peptide [Acinetobacter haemolyticus]